jgi:hypothetical protein
MLHISDQGAEWMWDPRCHKGNTASRSCLFLSFFVDGSVLHGQQNIKYWGARSGPCTTFEVSISVPAERATSTRKVLRAPAWPGIFLTTTESNGTGKQCGVGVRTPKAGRTTNARPAGSVHGPGNCLTSPSKLHQNFHERTVCYAHNQCTHKIKLL